jgi:hypothetical protein
MGHGHVGGWEGFDILRRKPYTALGIKRLKCIRPGCNNRAHASWQVCADKRIFRPVCEECDVAINEMVLRFMQPPGWEESLKRYKEDPHVP